MTCLSRIPHQHLCFVTGKSSCKIKMCDFITQVLNGYMKHAHRDLSVGLICAIWSVFCHLSRTRMIAPHLSCITEHTATGIGRKRMLKQKSIFLQYKNIDFFQKPPLKSLSQVPRTLTTTLLLNTSPQLLPAMRASWFKCYKYEVSILKFQYFLSKRNHQIKILLDLWGKLGKKTGTWRTFL